MKYAVIDIGSNTIHLSVYHVLDGGWKYLFSEKMVVGLAGYVKQSQLSLEGMEAAIACLLDFKERLALFAVNKTYVFATAALRNIKNSAAATCTIAEKTGFSIEILSGEDEAVISYLGARHNSTTQDGVLIDIGGGSTELIEFADEEISHVLSLALGSLNLYKKFVKDLLPTAAEYRKMHKLVLKTYLKSSAREIIGGKNFIGVGGTVRATLKLYNRYYQFAKENKFIKPRQFKELLEWLRENKCLAGDLILKCCPDRTHTIIPGMVILQTIMTELDSTGLKVSRYGVREGYLCQMLAKEKDEQRIVLSPKTAN